MNGSNRAVVLLSGGMDSATTAYIARAAFDEISTLFFQYGQRTMQKETECFNAISKELGAVYSEIIELSFYPQFANSALTDKTIKIPSRDISGMIPNTYVPFRNGVMLSIAAAWAEANSYDNIFIGAVWEDSSGYPDCREDFLLAIEKAINIGTKPDFSVKLHYPVIHLKKHEIVQKGLELGVPFHKTWSCYQSNDQPCGNCPSCRLRQKAFAKASIIDPLL